MWVLTTLDNLAAHCDAESKCMHNQGHVFLCHLPKATTELTQMTDADHGRSMRCGVGRGLDEWLMKEENMDKWEVKMTTIER